MGLFRRRRGRHDLGGAVRDIPQAAPPVLVHPPAPPAPFVPAPPMPVPAAAAPVPAQGDAPRVELGFRDGSTAALAPESAQSRALVALAEVLTRGE